MKYFLGFIHSKLGTQAFSLAKGLKSFGSKASQGSSFIKKGGAVKSLLAGAAGGGAVGIAAGLFAAGKMAISRNRNASTLAKTTGMSKQTASSILSSPGLKLNEQQQKMFTQNISKSGLDLSKVNSMSELQTQLRVKEQLVDQEVSKLQQDKRYGSNTAPKFNEKTHRIMEELATIKQNNEMLNSILSQGGQTNASE
ncbi:Uncharacterised protein [Metamycoplasma alkalescens]|uniref:Uncharacterized protein n=1 Tax=Metamycoplasma alkalescens TaxID=45363 RepID=A0A3B0PK65_9BACT|nr:Uncharacterised protein [Metamycoplasma alkalescens]